MLASDVRLTADGGGKVAAVTDVLEGEAVLAFLTERLSEWWAAYEWSFAELNGAQGLVLKQAGEVVATVSFAFNRSDRVSEIFIVRNPDKLAGLSDISIH
jgi:hypothetical protein